MHDDPHEYAGFWIRTAASLIDTVLVAMLTLPPLVWIYGWDYFDPGRTGVFAGPADVLLSWLLPRWRSSFSGCTDRPRPAR